MDNTDGIEHILKHLNLWCSQPKNISAAAGPGPPWPQGETIPLTCHPLPDRDTLAIQSLTTESPRRRTFL